MFVRSEPSVAQLCLSVQHCPQYACANYYCCPVTTRFSYAMGHKEELSLKAFNGTICSGCKVHSNRVAAGMGTPRDVTYHTSLSRRAANWNIINDRRNKTGQELTGRSIMESPTARWQLRAVADRFHRHNLNTLHVLYSVNQKVKVQFHDKNRYVTVSLRKQNAQWLKSIYRCCGVSQQVSDLYLSLSLSLEVESCESSFSRPQCDPENASVLS